MHVYQCMWRHPCCTKICGIQGFSQASLNLHVEPVNLHAEVKWPQLSRGSFRKFSIKINFTLKSPIPRSPCLDSDHIHACTTLATRQSPWLRSRISLLWMTNERFVCSEQHWYWFAKFEDCFSSWTCVHSCLTCVRVRKKCSVGKHWAYECSRVTVHCS